jgi:uncharacterized membrane protein YqjE
MSTNGENGPALATLIRKVVSTGAGALQNRGELLMVEVQEEKLRLVNLILRGVAGLFLAMMTMLLITGTLIYVMPEEYRLYAVAGFAALYLGATIWLIMSVKSLIKRIPFGETLAQFKRDTELLEVFNERT